MMSVSSGAEARIFFRALDGMAKAMPLQSAIDETRCGMLSASKS
jgi:hypothetical protein